MPSFLRKGLKIIAHRKKHEQICTVLVLCWSLVLVRRLQWQPISELLLGVILFGAPFTCFFFLACHIFAAGCCLIVPLGKQQSSFQYTTALHTFQAMMNVFFLFLLCPGFTAALIEPRLRTGSEKVCVSFAPTSVLRVGFRTCL